MAVIQKPFAKMRAEKACTTGDEDTHRETTLKERGNLFQQNWSLKNYPGNPRLAYMRGPGLFHPERKLLKLMDAPSFIVRVSVLLEHIHQGTTNYKKEND